MMRDWRLLLVLCLAGLFVLAALVGWLAPPFDPLATDIATRLQSPSAVHWLGTDNYGRDVLSRILAGAATSLTVALLSVALALTAGIALGGAAGYLGGWVDGTITVIVESLMAFPGILLALALAAVLQGSVYGLVVALGVAQTPAAVRQLRAAILSVKEREYVEAARALGHSRLRIFIEQILPNSITPLIVLASTLVSGTLLAESALSFLGVGVAPPSPTWGNMLAEGRRQMRSAPLLVVFPGLAITLAVYGANLAGDILRDRLDPRMRRTAA